MALSSISRKITGSRKREVSKTPVVEREASNPATIPAHRDAGAKGIEGIRARGAEEEFGAQAGAAEQGITPDGEAPVGQQLVAVIHSRQPGQVGPVRGRREHRGNPRPGRLGGSGA